MSKSALVEADLSWRPQYKGGGHHPADRPPRSDRAFSRCYGVYQIGEVYARSCVIIGTSSGMVIPNRTCS